MKVSDLKKYLEQFNDNQEIDFIVNTSTNVEDSDNDIRPNIELQGNDSDVPTILLHKESDKKFFKINHCSDYFDVIIADSDVSYDDISNLIDEYFNFEIDKGDYDNILDFLSYNVKGFESVNLINVSF